MSSDPLTSVKLCFLDMLLPYQPNTSCARQLLPVTMETVNGGIPKGTKLGLTFFGVMINQLLRNQHMRMKYVDETTTFEIISRNSISMCYCRTLCNFLRVIAIIWTETMTQMTTLIPSTRSVCSRIFQVIVLKFRVSIRSTVSRVCITV